MNGTVLKRLPQDKIATFPAPPLSLVLPFVTLHGTGECRLRTVCFGIRFLSWLRLPSSRLRTMRPPSSRTGTTSYVSCRSRAWRQLWAQHGLLPLTSGMKPKRPLCLHHNSRFCSLRNFERYCASSIKSERSSARMRRTPICRWCSALSRGDFIGVFRIYHPNQAQPLVGRRSPAAMDPAADNSQGMTVAMVVPK